MNQLMMIKECANDSDIQSTFPIMQQLRPYLADVKSYLDLIHLLQKTQKYTLVGLFDEDKKCVAAAGFRIKRSLFSRGEPELYVDDLVTDHAHRSSGLGKKLLDFLKAEAQRLGCKSIALDSGVQRVEAHRFYKREGMEATGLRFFSLIA